MTLNRCGVQPGARRRVMVVADSVDDVLASELTAMWVDVTNRGGGGVGFDAPVTVGDVRPVAQSLWASLGEHSQLVIAYERAQPVAWLAVVGNPDRKQAHWAWVKRMQVATSSQRRGIGGALLECAVNHASERGLSQLYLTTDAQAGPVGFYRARGFREVGRMPRSQRVGEEFHDELYMVRDLR